MMLMCKRGDARSFVHVLVVALFMILGFAVKFSSGINCYCSEEPSAGFPECHWQDYTCSGDVCYVRRTLENGVFYTTWDCLRRSAHHIDLICGGAFDSSTDRYVCCSDSNNCNEHLQIALPIELPTEQSTIIPSTTTQLGPSSSTIVPINNIISPSIIQPSAPAVTLLDSSSIGMQSTKLAIVAPSTVSSVNAAVQSTSLVPESTSVPTAKDSSAKCIHTAEMIPVIALTAVTAVMYF